MINRVAPPVIPVLPDPAETIGLRGERGERVSLYRSEYRGHYELKPFLPFRMKPCIPNHVHRNFASALFDIYELFPRLPRVNLLAVQS